MKHTRPTVRSSNWNAEARRGARKCAVASPRGLVRSESGLLLAIVLSLAAMVHSASGAECSTNYPFPGVICRTETRHEPPMRCFIAEVNLSDPRIHVRVAPGGPDPDGPGRWQTTLMPPTQIAAREGFDLVVNGDFFDARGVKNMEGTNSHYRGEIWGAVDGPAVTDGKVWSTCASSKPCLVVHKNGKAAIEMMDHPAPDDWEVVAGNTLLLQHGVPVPHQSKTRHPRTVVGLDATGTRLILLVVDGRRPGVAVGMSYDELAAEMLRLGCREALNLDGGGSSVMAIRNPATEKFRILNEPTDGRERAVANALGVTVDRPERVGAARSH